MAHFARRPVGNGVPVAYQSAPHILESPKQARHSERPHSQPEAYSASVYDRWSADWWLWEIIAALAGIGALVGIVLVLHDHDGEPVPLWGSFFNTTITLNSVLAILATLARVALAVPIVACISQLKWMHYAKSPKPLEDFELFDDASRGAIGAGYFFWRFRGLHLACTGAVLIFFAFAIDPMIQQLVVYVPGNVQSPSSDVWTPMPSLWRDPNQAPCFSMHGVPAPCTPSLETTGAVVSGFLGWNSSQRASLSDIVPKCGSRNCTWPAYTSLAVCAASADVSANLETTFTTNDDSMRTWTASLPNDMSNYTVSSMGEGNMTVESLLGSSMTYNSAWMSINASTVREIHLDLRNNQALGNKSIAFSAIPNPIAHASIVYPSGTMDPRNGTEGFSAYEIIFYWCAQTYKTAVVDGEVKTELATKQVPYGAFHLNGTQEEIYLVPSASLTALGPKSDASPGNLSVDIHSHWGLQSWMQLTMSAAPCYMYTPPFPALCEQPSNLTMSLAPSEQVPLAIFNTLCPAMNCSIPNGWKQLNSTLENMAVTLTNQIRRGAVAPDGITGIKAVQTTYVSVQWVWLALPLAFLALTLCFFVATVLLQRASPTMVWKSSSLATMQSLHPDVQAVLGSLSTPTVLSGRSRSIHVMLNRDRDTGWRLMPQVVERIDR